MVQLWNGETNTQLWNGYIACVNVRVGTDTQNITIIGTASYDVLARKLINY